MKVMKSRHWTGMKNALTVAALGLAAFEPRAEASQQSALYEPPGDLMASALHQAGEFSASGSGSGLSLETGLSPRKKAVTILLTNEQDEASNHQEIPVGFFPTALLGTSNWGEIFVGGTNKFGNTKIVKYQLSDPGVDSSGKPRDASILFMDEVFVATNQSSTRDVYQIMPNRADPGQLLVQFWNTRSVYALTLETGQVSMVAASSPQTDPTVVVIEGLASPHTFTYSRNHINSGFVYFFCPLAPGDGPTAILRDIDRDGTVDDGLTLTQALYQSMGFGDTSLYLD